MAVASPPGTARLHHLLGVTLEWCGLRGGAAQAFRDAIRQAPDHAETWFRLGDALARGGRWREASEAFGEAVRRAPECMEYQGNLTLALARASQWDAAVRALRRLAQLRPHEGEGYVLLGSVLKQLGRNDEAIRAFRWAIRLRPAPVTRRFVLGEALLGERGWRDAIAAWLDARRLPHEDQPRPSPGRSALHGHPGAALLPGAAGASVDRALLAARPRRAANPPREVLDDLRREARDREILHAYREALSFPVRDGDRPARVHVTPRPAHDGRRAPGSRT